MRQPSSKEIKLINRIDSKFIEISDGLMEFTGSIKPLLLLEFQGYLDYLKIIEKRLSFWEIKNLDIDHQVGPYYLEGRILKLNLKANLEVFTPGVMGPLSIYLTYNSEDKKKKLETFSRWKLILEDL